MTGKREKFRSKFLIDIQRHDVTNSYRKNSICLFVEWDSKRSASPVLSAHYALICDFRSATDIIFAFGSSRYRSYYQNPAGYLYMKRNIGGDGSNKSPAFFHFPIFLFTASHTDSRNMSIRLTLDQFSLRMITSLFPSMPYTTVLMNDRLQKYQPLSACLG